MLDLRLLSDQAYETLKQMIFQQVFRDGERLDCRALAARFGISQTPLKRALERLAAEGLVQVHPRRGTYVAPLTPAVVAQVFEVRLLIELHAAERGVERASPEDLDRLGAMLAEFGAWFAGPTYTDYERFIARDFDFHCALVALAGNPLLWQIYRRLNTHVYVARAHYLRSLDQAERIHREHQAILAAYRQRDRAAAVERLRAHILGVQADLLRVLQERQTISERG